MEEVHLGFTIYLREPNFRPLVEKILIELVKVAEIVVRKRDFNKRK